MTITLEQAWAEFQLADLTPTAPKNGEFQALCPVCRGLMLVTLDGRGEIRFDCWEDCDAARVADELFSRSSRAMLNGQPATPAPEGAERRVILTPASAITPAPVRWLMRGLVPLRGAVVIAGDPGLGKSIFTDAWLVAQVTLGLLDGDYSGRPADVLIASAEDDWSTVIVPRLMAAGADLARVHLVSIQGGGERLLTVPDDLERVDKRLDGLAGAGQPAVLFVIDPISAFLSDAIDSHRDAHVRRALAPLADIAAQRDLVAAVVAHLTKDASQRLLQRVSGATAFGAAPRSVLAFARHPDDPEGERGSMRAIVHAKSNWGRYGPTLAARVEGRLIDLPNGEATETGYLVMLGETNVTAEDLQRGRDDDTGGRDIEEAIADQLAGGPRPSKEVKGAVAAEIGCSRRTVERHAVGMVEIGELEIIAEGFPRRTIWALPGGDTASSATGTVVTEQTRMGQGIEGGQDSSDAKDPALSRLDEYRRHRDRMLGEGEEDE